MNNSRSKFRVDFSVVEQPTIDSCLKADLLGLLFFYYKNYPFSTRKVVKYFYKIILRDERKKND